MSTITDLTEKIRNVQRYDIVICNCSFGPHMDLEPSELGNFYKWEDVEEILKSYVEEN